MQLADPAARAHDTVLVQHNAQVIHVRPLRNGLPILPLVHGHGCMDPEVALAFARLTVEGESHADRARCPVPESRDRRMQATSPGPTSSAPDMTAAVLLAIIRRLPAGACRAGSP